MLTGPAAFSTAWSTVSEEVIGPLHDKLAVDGKFVDWEEIELLEPFAREPTTPLDRFGPRRAARAWVGLVAHFDRSSLTPDTIRPSSTTELILPLAGMKTEKSKWEVKFSKVNGPVTSLKWKFKDPVQNFKNSRIFGPIYNLTVPRFSISNVNGPVHHTKKICFPFFPFFFLVMDGRDF